MLRRGGARLVVALPQREIVLDALPAALALGGAHGSSRVIRLDSGAEQRLAWRDEGGGAILSAPVRCTVPTLLLLRSG
jgi:hypothetical protein